MLRKSHGSSRDTRKSKALAVGGWSTSTDTLNISWHAEIKILGVNFASTNGHSVNNNWANVTSKAKAQARDRNERNLSLSQRIPYVQSYLLAKLCHTAHVFPAATTCTGQLTTATACYLQKPKRQVFWVLFDIELSWSGECGTYHEEQFCNCDIAPGMELGWTKGESPSHRMETRWR